MFNAFRFILQVSWFVIAFMITMLGLNWLDPEIAHGLNPWIAFPVAFIIMAIVVRSIISDIRHEVMLHRMALVQRQQQEYRQFMQTMDRITRVQREWGIK